jgi:hypothetical protein
LQVNRILSGLFKFSFNYLGIYFKNVTGVPYSVKGSPKNGRYSISNLTPKKTFNMVKERISKPKSGVPNMGHGLG